MGARRRFSDEERLERKRHRQMLAGRIKRAETYTRGPYGPYGGEEQAPPEVLAARERRKARAARRLPMATPTEWWIGAGKHWFTETDYAVLLG